MIRFDCHYYPCHDNLEDCYFCYCPCYPCELPKTGGKWLHIPDRESIWDCSKCRVFHTTKMVDKVKNYMRKLLKEYE